MPETTPLIKAALNLRVGAGFDVYEVITIITQKRKGRSSIYKTIFHLHVCMTYFCFIKYKSLSNWKLLFQLSYGK